MTEAKVLIAGSHIRGSKSPARQIVHQLVLAKDEGRRDGYDVGSLKNYHRHRVGVKLFQRDQIEVTDIPRA